MPKQQAPTTEPAPAAPNFARNIASTSIDELALSRIWPWELNPRSHIDDAELEDLIASVREFGVLEPLLVRPDPERKGEYIIVAGHRRYRAAQIAQRMTVPARVLVGLSDIEILKIALIENLQRKQLDPIDEAEGYQRLQDLGMKQSEIAQSVNRSQPAIANALRLLDLPEAVQERIRKRELTQGHGIALARFKEFPAVADKLAEVAVKQKLSTHDLEKGVPRAWDLEQDGLVKILGYNSEVDTEACKQCPFDAYRNGGYGGGICLRPDHYEVLKAARRAEQAAAAAAKAGVEVEGLPNLRDMHYDEYEQIWGSAPEGCGPDCACRSQAINHAGQVVAICTDPKRFQAFRDAEQKRADQELADRLHAAYALIAERVDALTEIGSRELAVIARETVVTGGWAADLTGFLRSSAQRQGLPFTEATDWMDVRTIADKLSPLQLGRLLLEATLRRGMNERVRGRQDGATPVTWYLGLTEMPFAGCPNCPCSNNVNCTSGCCPPGTCAGCDGLGTDDDDEVVDLIAEASAAACFICDCLDDDEAGACSDPGCCEPSCREQGVVMVTRRGGVCATCKENMDICRVCGCTNDEACDGGCDWAEEGLCSQCVGVEAPAATAVEPDLVEA